MAKRPLLIITLLLLMYGHAFADSPSLILRGGIFLPNGTASGGAKQGLADFDSGVSVSGGVAIPLAPYADLEVTAGYYTGERNLSAPGSASSTTLTGVPLLAAVKFVHETEMLRLTTGAGGGYLIATVEETNPIGTATAHGGALSYLLTAGASYHLTGRLSLGADVTWFKSEPTIDLTAIGERKSPWDVGGTVISLTLGWRFQ